MEIRTAKNSEVREIKKLFDSASEMDTTEETFSERYYKRIIKKGILLVSVKEEKIIGACFGTYNKKEEWADFLGIVVRKEFRNKGIGKSLIREFEKVVKEKKLKTIDLYADKKEARLFKRLNYKKGGTYIAFRKKLK